jgi:membrane protein DedA with SNARE-associated domain
VTSLAHPPLIDQLISGLSEWQIYGLVVGLLLQGVVIAIAPEEVILMSLGVLWSQGKVRLFLALGAAAIGLLAANAIIVFITGRFSHLAIFQKKSVHQALEKFRKKGRWIIFVTRFTPFIRGPVYYAAGISGMPVSRFFPIDALAFCIHAPLIFFIGAWIGIRTGSITEAYKIIIIAAVSTVVVIVAGVFVRERLRERRTAAAALASK